MHADSIVRRHVCTISMRRSFRGHGFGHNYQLPCVLIYVPRGSRPRQLTVSSRWTLQRSLHPQYAGLRLEACLACLW